MTVTVRGLPFWDRVEKTATCWLWTGSIRGRGYGVFNVGGRRAAHRLAYEEIVGPIPAGLTIDHLCEVKRCVNPAHMEPVSLQENIRRSWATGRHGVRVGRGLGHGRGGGPGPGPGKASTRTHCHLGHPLPSHSVDPRRRCQTCRRALKRRLYAESKVAR